mmetsp:Transcript_10286/g.19446  ORF Transcript_10286/g.19446 Transcript_10286/m.19446 type:complete len:274 (+) Transcript_10286:1-822(+)
MPCAFRASVVMTQVVGKASGGARGRVNNIVPREKTLALVSSFNTDVKTLIFDLDGTLYPSDNGYVAHHRTNAERYMHTKLGIPLDKVSEIRKKALAIANQTVKGLRILGYTEFDAAEMIDYMRTGEELFLQPDSEVQEFLSSLAQPKWVLTNTGEGPARRALECLGIEQHFQGILGAEFMGDMCKPQLEVFQKALDHIGADAATTVMFEDSLRNIRASKQLGMGTVFIQGEDTEQGLAEAGPDDVDISTIADAVVAKCSVDELSLQLRKLWTD